jgi:hypothetical protein
MANHISFGCGYVRTTLQVTGMKAMLVLCDVEGPVAIKALAQRDGSEVDDCLGHLSPEHSRSLDTILDEILARTLDGPLAWASPW